MATDKLMSLRLFLPIRFLSALLKEEKNYTLYIVVLVQKIQSESAHK